MPNSHPSSHCPGGFDAGRGAPPFQPKTLYKNLTGFARKRAEVVGRVFPCLKIAHLGLNLYRRHHFCLLDQSLSAHDLLISGQAVPARCLIVTLPHIALAGSTPAGASFFLVRYVLERIRIYGDIPCGPLTKLSRFSRIR